MYQVLVNGDQRKFLSPEIPNISIFYVTVIGGTSCKGWDVQWDDFPFENNVTYKVKWTFLTVLSKVVKEVRFNGKNQDQIDTE